MHWRSCGRLIRRSMRKQWQSGMKLTDGGAKKKNFPKKLT
jgi:hypothetical protein